MMNDQETLQFDYSNYSPARLEDLAPGTLLGKEKNYRLEKFLGAGGMGHAWLATEIEEGNELRKVVCKILPALLQREQFEMKKVLKTFRLVQPLSHPNICPIYALKADPVYGYFFVMGYADGGTLEEWIYAQPDYAKGLSVAQVMEVLRPIAKALDHAHEMGIIHRDVKPQNILFATRGGRKTPWLIDFGISAQIHSTVTQTLCDRGSSGTPVYMAPEQCQNLAQDGRTDQYELGVLVYQLLSGHLPFRADNPVLLWREIVYTPAPPMTNVSGPINEVLQRALAKERKDRFASCMEFMEALEAAEKVEEKRGFLSSLWKSVLPVAETLKKHKWASIAGGLVLLMAGYFLLGRPEKPTQPEPVTVAPPVVLEEEPTEPKPDFGDTKDLAPGARKVLTVDGIKYAFRWCPPGEFMMGGDRVIVRRYDTLKKSDQHPVTLTKGFWMLETEVTQAMWQSVMGTSPSEFKGLQNPVERVSWDECQDFCWRLSQKLGLRIQLPTEAQWEYACRAGSTGIFYWGDDEDQLCQYGNYCDKSNTDGYEWQDKEHNDGYDKTAPVGSYKPNAWGLYDMSGNVWEWCSDYFDEDYYTWMPTKDPENPRYTMYRSIRGGCWDYIPDLCRSAHRDKAIHDLRRNIYGFRILLAPSDEPVTETEPQNNIVSADSKSKPGGPESNIAAGTRKVLTADGVEYAFRWCPPGEFIMGGDATNHASTPIHKVTLTKGFWLLETEVTQEMWKSVMGTNPSEFKGDKYPVEYIGWQDCPEFCRKLGAKLKQKIQLPTEAQWEYACRAGTMGDYIGNLQEMGWFKDNSGAGTHPAGLKKPNAWGLYDMHGNVWEWCLDHMGSYSSIPVTDPTGPQSGGSYLVRGGCWHQEESCALAWYRGWGPSYSRKNDCGFRVLMLPDSDTSDDVQSTQSDDSDFVVRDSVLTKYTGHSSQVVIPAVVRGEKVMVIGKEAFMNCRMTSVVIPEGVTKIEDDAFRFCHSLTRVTIPASLRTISFNPFTYCTSLKEWSISPSNSYFKSIGICLVRKYGSELIACPAATGDFSVPEGVMELGEAPFQGCNSLNSVVIPEGVTKIGSGAFFTCKSITSVTMPASLRNIVGNPFVFCESLKKLTISSANPNYKCEGTCITTKDGKTIIACPAVSGEFRIPEGVTNIRYSAFEGDASLTSVVFPASLKTLGIKVFANCPALRKWTISPENPYFKSEGIALLTKDGQKIVSCPAASLKYQIPEGVTELGDWSFDGCKSLTSMDVPKGVKRIGEGAFLFCSSLASIYIPESVTDIHRFAFSYCPNLTIHAPAGSKAEEFAKQNQIQFKAQ